MIPWKTLLFPTILCVAAGSGAVAGEFLYRDVHAPDDLCGTCHHGGVTSDRPLHVHSRDFSSSCHTCHVLPVREYLAFWLADDAGHAPAWVQGLQNPLVAEQSCLECHLSMGRGHIVCESCHSEGSSKVGTRAACTSCHPEHPTSVPHDRVACHVCHPETMLGTSGFQEPDATSSATPAPSEEVRP